MTTASQILTGAARTLGYLGRTETLNAADAADALTCFNQMLDSWSTESLISYVKVERSFVLTINKQSYTIGTGGFISTVRPVDIVFAYIRDANNFDYPVNVVGQERWNAIGLKSTVSQIPTTLYYDSQYPLGVINIWPVPLLAYTLFYDSTLDQIQSSLLTSTITMPVGYELAYRLNLALQLVSYGFPCMLGPAELSALAVNAAEAKANIKRANIKDVVATYDDALVGHSHGTYNIYRDA